MGFFSRRLSRYYLNHGLELYVQKTIITINAGSYSVQRAFQIPTDFVGTRILFYIHVYRSIGGAGRVPVLRNGKVRDSPYSRSVPRLDNRSTWWSI